MFLQLQHLFEAESVSFLDEVAKAGNLHLAKTVASEVCPYMGFCYKIDNLAVFDTL